MKQLTLGDITITRVAEGSPLLLNPLDFFDAATEDAIAQHREWLQPHFMDASGRLLLSMHTYVVKTRHHTILVDTCIGNDKVRSSMNNVSNLQTTYLDDLRAVGVAPNDVDYVLCTHLHFDHVGWNTRLEKGQWVPTFPKAKYLFAQDEWAYWQHSKEGEFGYDAIQDSVAPIMKTEQAMLVDSDHVIEDGLRLAPLPGHTPGLVSLNVESKGQKAVLFGDLMHHPIQMAEPDWTIRADVDADQAKQTRRSFLERHSDVDVLLLAAHFPGPTVGRATGSGDAWRFDVLER